MVSNRAFAVRLAARVSLLLAATATAAALLVFGRAPTAALLALVAVGGAGAALWRLVNQGNRDLARFVAALERSDLGQSFRWEGRGAGFDRLGAAYEQALERLRDDRARGAVTTREAQVLVDGAPTPLLVLGPGADGEVRFANKAARRLFGRADPCPMPSLAPFGAAFVAALRAAAPGPTQLAPLILDGLSQRVALDTTSVEIGGQARRVVALKIIQAELDGAEVAAQVDLVRVLTHEVMNSLTPVTSLAATASRLMVGLDPGSAPGIADAQLAIEALARRAVDLERFVTSYKGFSEAPVLHRAALPVAGWFAQLGGLFATMPAAQSTRVTWSVPNGTPDLDGDAGLLTQVMLNLLKNASEAAAAADSPAIEVAAAVAFDGRVRITVVDNGPGVPPELARDVFLPFFTTKPAGTGIGLSFARQIVMLHGGQIGIGAHGCGYLEMLLPTSGQRRTG